VKTLKPQHLKIERETRDSLWKAVRTLREFTVPDIADECDLAYNSISRYLANLVKAGILEVEPGAKVPDGKSFPGAAGRRRTYRLLRDSLDPPRIRPDGTEIDAHQATQRMWSTIRNRKIFNLPDLHALSSTTQHPVARSAAMQYLKYLEYAGYVRKVEGTELARATYRLVNNTGPKAPMVQRIHQVWDPNTRKVVWPLPDKDKAEGAENG